MYFFMKKNIYNIIFYVKNSKIFIFFSQKNILMKTLIILKFPKY